MVGAPPQGTGGNPDDVNDAIKETRDVLKESKKQTTILIILTVLMAIMMGLQVYAMFFQ